MADTQRKLEVALRPQTQPDVERIVNEMKNNALATSNWEQLVSSAPVALRCLGACFMAAGSKDLTSVQVPMLPGATVQRPPYLSANLVRCSNLGTTAFLEANKGMAEIYQLSAQSENKVYDIVEVVGNPRVAAKQLPSLLSQLQDSAGRCYETSKRIDERFGEWLAFTSELFEACQNQSSVVADEQQKNITEKAVAAQNAKDTEKMVTSTKVAMEELSKTMDVARNSYKKASDNQPTGWDILGQQLVSGLGQALITGLNAAMQPKAHVAAKVAADDKTPASSSAPAPKPQTQSDPALAHVQKDLYLYNFLKSIIEGPDNDVNWEASKAAGANSGLDFISAMLLQSKADFDKQTSTSFVATQYKQILSDITQIVGEMQKASKDAVSSMSAKLPVKGSETVVKWQTSFSGAYKSVLAMDVQAKSLPYSSPSASPAIPDPSLERAKIDAQSSQTQAVLQHAAIELETTAGALETVSKVYGDTQNLLTEQQQQLATLNGTLARLTAGAIKLEESKEILISCIALIVELKARIVDLVNFFGTLSAVIKTVSQNLVGNWIETVKNSVTNGDAKAINRIGQYSLEAAERSMILNGSITIGAYYSFFADVARTWRSVSERNIFPGIQLAESLSVPGDAREKMDKLDKWSKDAQENIKNECKRRQEEIQAGMRERVDEVAKMITQVGLHDTLKTVTGTVSETAGLIQDAQKEAIKAEGDDTAFKIAVTRRRDI